ncbi:hypothetical protein ACJX0J_025857, partial [Zea mays]
IVMYFFCHKTQPCRAYESIPLDAVYHPLGIIILGETSYPQHLLSFMPYYMEVPLLIGELHNTYI